MVGITKFDLNYTSVRPQRRGQSRSITIDDVRQNVVRSIKEATSVDINEDSVLQLCSDWALISIKLARSLVDENNDVTKEMLKKALSSLEKHPHSDHLPRDQGESLADVNHDPHKVIECLNKASGIHTLKKWYILIAICIILMFNFISSRIRHVVEVACVKAWATNLCNQLKSCADRVNKCICVVSKQKGINIGGTYHRLINSYYYGLLNNIVMHMNFGREAS